MGNDPYNGMNMALADRFGIPYPTVQILVNLVFFAVQLMWGRDMIGIGTIVNTFLLGYIVNGSFLVLWFLFGAANSLVAQVVSMMIGMVILCLGLSLYQRSEMGTAPYDAFSLILTRNLEKVPYFWCRIVGDAACALICFLAGGLMGLGTLVSAFCLGPVIAFFDRTVSAKVLAKDIKE